jgi:thiol-disulfide isomerase/thioredoxin
MLPPQSDTFAFETFSYLKQVDSSKLDQAEKNHLTFERLKNYITKRPGEIFFGEQFLWINKYLDTASLNILFNLFDSSIQKLYAERFNAIKIRASILPGKKFPEMILTDTLNQLFKITDLKGKVVLIDFWASWCVPCRAEMPHMITLYEKYKSKGFVVVAISIDEHKEDWLKAIRNDSLPWMHFCELVSVDNSIISKKWGVFSIPYKILIDKNGVIVDKDMPVEMLDEKLVKLL